MGFARCAVVMGVTGLAGLLGACSSDDGVASTETDGDASPPAIVHGPASDGGGESTGDAGAPEAAVPSTPPTPSGCITDVSSGEHTFTCEGLQVSMRVPAACQAPGCGLILDLHGDTGTGPLEDAHTKLHDLGETNGYVVLSPSGPPKGLGGGSTWTSADDAKLVAIVQAHAAVFRTDPKKVHVTGFSRGGFVTWRLLCDHADLFASAAPGGAGDGSQYSETTCFSKDRAPSRKLPILMLMGRTDVNVGYASMAKIRDAALKNYGTQEAGSPTVLASGTGYTHNQWKSQDGAILESFEHDYQTVSPGPWSYAKGHCYPGSTVDPQAPQYALPCKPPNAFVWGQEVMTFFRAHPMP